MEHFVPVLHLNRFWIPSKFLLKYKIGADYVIYIFILLFYSHNMSHCRHFIHIILYFCSVLRQYIILTNCLFHSDINSFVHFFFSICTTLLLRNLVWTAQRNSELLYSVNSLPNCLLTLAIPLTDADSDILGNILVIHVVIMLFSDCWRCCQLK